MGKFHENAPFCVYRLFRKMDSNNSGYLEFEEFKAGIEKYELQLNEQVCMLNLVGFIL